jgi:hypothetical protein
VGNVSQSLKWLLFAAVVLGLPLTAPQMNTSINAAGYFRPGTFVDGPEPTNEQVTACISDALKFCDIKVVDRNEIKACLLRHRNQLSAECRGAFR